MKLATIATGQHRARYLTVDGQRVRIDENIYDLVSGLLRLGIRTFSSCGASCGGWCRRKHRLLTKRAWYVDKAGHRRTYWKFREPRACQESVWLVFESPRDATRFLNVVYRESDPSGTRDAMEGCGPDHVRWTWGVHTSDVNDGRCIDHRGYWVGQRAGKPKFEFIAGVVFPHVHLDMVTERVLARCRKDGI